MYGFEADVARLLEEKYSGVKSLEFLKDVERLRDDEPLPYILGYKDFLGVRVDLSCRPMIPRDETAFWVRRAIAELSAKDKGLRVHDAFSGSGCVGLAVLKNVTQAFVEITEFDGKLLPGIEKTVNENNLDKGRVKIFEADALSGLSGEYDAIFANPPYIAHKYKDDLDVDMIKYEPHLAFFAEEDGYFYQKRVISEGASFLKEGGSLYIETDSYQRENIIEIIKKSNSWNGYEFWPDPYEAEPFLVLRK